MCMLLKLGMGAVFVGETPDNHRIILYKWQNEWLLQQHLHQLHEHPEKFRETPLHMLPIIEIDSEGKVV